MPPWNILIFKNSTIFQPYAIGYSTKINFFLYPILYKKKSPLLKTKMSDEMYDFVRSLPKELTRWMIIEHLACIFGFACCLLGLLAFKLSGN